MSKKNHRFQNKNEGFISIYVPDEGFLDRKFRNMGETVGFLIKNYGKDWKKMGIRVQNVVLEAKKELKNGCFDDDVSAWY